METFEEKTDDTMVDASTPPAVRTRYGPASLVDVCEEEGGFVVDWVQDGPRPERGPGNTLAGKHAENESEPRSQERG